ncbi:MAG: signal peptidase I [Coriobacteriia bacterium]
MRELLRRNAPSIISTAIVGIILVLALTIWTPVRVDGGSMEPALNPGDIALVHNHAAAEKGDVVLVEERGHDPYLHRVIGKADDGCLKLKGDANPIADSAGVPVSAIQGPVVAVIPFGEWAEEWRRSMPVR